MRHRSARVTMSLKANQEYRSSNKETGYDAKEVIINSEAFFAYKNDD